MTCINGNVALSLQKVYDEINNYFRWTNRNCVEVTCTNYDSTTKTNTIFKNKQFEGNNMYFILMMSLINVTPECIYVVKC